MQQTLDALQRAAEGTENTMPYLLDAVRAYATLGEICDALRGVFGTYQETHRTSKPCHDRFEYWWPSPGWTATTAAPR